MKKIILILLALLFLAGCSKPTKSEQLEKEHRDPQGQRR